MFEMFQIVDKSGLDGLREYFVKESNVETSNMIVDSLFKDLFPNVKSDVLELIKFNERSNNKTLSVEELNAYKLISNIDNLSFDDKCTVYNNLKGQNLTEKFYDDIRNAKNASYQMIKDSMVTEDSLKSKLNQDKSNEEGVNIYELSGEPFYALVKSLVASTSNVLESDIRNATVEGGSYSLIGTDNLSTFKEPKDYYTLVYTDFDINNVVHTFPIDSFSNYRHNDDTNGTNRINEIHTPESFYKVVNHIMKL